jgi:hypothetical protein
MFYIIFDAKIIQIQNQVPFRRFAVMQRTLFVVVPVVVPISIPIVVKIMSRLLFAMQLLCRH